ncbi:D-TA family PLP-dependent enzyme [Sphingobacterium sp. DR205]|uniref:D-TA family PLP-dependent enzyme n=1 Tax=Sphingobacterium sp. DR205 TaxID=2713573 RepID=UPI0013E48140|nr:D-TA family PLP-dependent enzyme [Sphingobacterium sp. DR205]QIH33216.1 D-TA family PLP-dependent enzyme [Sphingobacterium sp. DR205]
MENWYRVQNADQVDSPALLVYPDRIVRNIERALKFVNGDAGRLRPHIKTNKCREVCQLLLDSGISKFKCATIAEAELLGMVGAKDVLLAYQPVGPKIDRLLHLIEAFPNTHYACLVDNADSAHELSARGLQYGRPLAIYIDVNVGMGRTGASIAQIERLVLDIQLLDGIHLMGVHGYDGHIHDKDHQVREQQSQQTYRVLEMAYLMAQGSTSTPLTKVIGGSPSFPFHAERDDVECSPGTFVFWDFGYAENYAEQDFLVAAVLLTRVVSIVDHKHLCLDLGYKSVASESPQPRVKFFDRRIGTIKMQSEEHLVVEVRDSTDFKIGDELYCVPRHICPTVACYDEVQVVDKGVADRVWKVLARSKKINY